MKKHQNDILFSYKYESYIINYITNKTFITDLCYRKKNLFCATTIVSDHN